MNLRHCLDCDRVTTTTRCPQCTRRHDRALSAAGRKRRGRGWTAKSRRLRSTWAAGFVPCAHADANCRGPIQADHVIAGSETGGFQPLCAYHNNQKGDR
jgi:hypothetical protein